MLLIHNAGFDGCLHKRFVFACTPMMLQRVKWSILQEMSSLEGLYLACQRSQNLKLNLDCLWTVQYFTQSALIGEGYVLLWGRILSFLCLPLSSMSMFQKLISRPICVSALIGGEVCSAMKTYLVYSMSSIIESVGRRRHWGLTPSSKELPWS